MSAALTSTPLPAQTAWAQTAVFSVLFVFLIVVVVVVLAGWRDRPDHTRSSWPTWWPSWLHLSGVDRLLFSGVAEQQVVGRRFAIGAANCLAGLLALNYGSWQGVIDPHDCLLMTVVALSVLLVLVVVLPLGELPVPEGLVVGPAMLWRWLGSALEGAKFVRASQDTPSR